MIIIAYKPGQLGNMLFQYSTFIAYNLEYGIPIKNPSFYHYQNYFEKTNKQGIALFPVKQKIFPINLLLKQRFLFWYYTARFFHRLTINNQFIKCIYLDWHQSINMVENHDLFVGKLVLVQGWQFNAKHLVSKYRAEIIDYFKPSEFHSNNVNLFLRSIKPDTVKIGVHIRHGDYLTFEGGKYYYGFEVYKFFLNQISKIFPENNLHFIICSNSIIDTEIFSNFSYSFGPGHEFEDMLTLSKCDYIIGPPSTYSMWASFYGNTPLVMIKNENQVIHLSDFKIYGDE